MGKLDGEKEKTPHTHPSPVKSLHAHTCVEDGQYEYSKAAPRGKQGVKYVLAEPRAVLVEYLEDVEDHVQLDRLLLFSFLRCLRIERDGGGMCAGSSISPRH